jgi:hypothetical protein
MRTIANEATIVNADGGRRRKYKVRADRGQHCIIRHCRSSSSNSTNNTNRVIPVH